MKLRILILLLLSILLFSCASTPPMSETNKVFMEETQLSFAIPMRFYTWVKVDNSKKVMPDIINGLLDFDYDVSGDFLLKTKTEDNKIVSIWGNQLFLQNEKYRILIFTTLIPSIYALEEGKEPINIAFEALKQILDDDAYKIYEKELIPVFQEGIKEYRVGKTAWENYKKEHFIVMEKTIIIK